MNSQKKLTPERIAEIKAFTGSRFMGRGIKAG
jgi:hypothetical protein